MSSSSPPSSASPALAHAGARAVLRRIAPALLLVGASVAAYWNSLDVPFVFDDQFLVESRKVHAPSLAPADLARAAVDFPFKRWLSFVTFAANHAVHGFRPFGYHAVNVAIHVLVALAFLRLAREILRSLGLGDDRRRRTAAAIAALLFAVHPIQTMAVTYVIQRMTSLGALFALGSLYLWLVARREGRVSAAPALGAVVLWYLAFSCKENYVVLPALAILVEWCSGVDLLAAARRNPRTWAAAAGALAAAAVVAVAVYGPFRSDSPYYDVPMAQRLLTQPRVLWHYVSLLAFPLPSRLHVDYAWQHSLGLLSPASTLPAAVALLAAAAGAAWLRRRLPLVTVAVGWFVVALAVEQSVIPVDFVFEHRVYFAGLGLFVLAGWAISSLRIGRIELAVPVAAALAAPLLLGTHLRNETWRDPVALFSDPVAAGPNRTRAIVNAARELRRRGLLDEAERKLREALALDPFSPRPYSHLALIASDRGQLEEAARWYEEAVARDAEDAEVLYNLGVTLGRLGRRDEARRAYERALSVDRGLTDARVNLALLAEAGGDRSGAIGHLDEAIRLDPVSALALLNRALLLAEQGRTDEALADATSALRLGPDDADAHFVMAKVHSRAGRLEAARESAAAALRLSPGHAEAGALARDLRR